MMPSERERFYLQVSEFRQGSLITDFDIVLQGVQLSLPLASGVGPQNIWALTKDTFSFLKTVCSGVQKGEEPTYEFNNDGDVHLHIGGEHHTYNESVIHNGELTLKHYQDLAHMLGPNKLTEISAGIKNSPHNDIYLNGRDHETFDIPTKIHKETTELKCEVFDFNKFKNAGKLEVTFDGQEIPLGEYNFSIVGDQDIDEYIYSLLKPQVVLFCLIEESINPFGGSSIHKLYVTGVG